MPTTDFSGSIGTTETKIREANPRRLWIGIQNTHATQTLRLGLRSPVSATAAVIDIQPKAYYEINMLNWWGGDIYIVGSGAGTTYIGQEVSQ